MLRAAAIALILTAAPASACPFLHVYMTVFEVRADPAQKDLIGSLVANAWTQVVPMKTCVTALSDLGELGRDRENGARVIDIACEPCSTRKQDHDRNMEERRVLWYNYAKEVLTKEMDNK